jgi:hypothetical protein
MYLAGVSIFSIMLIGRWSSNAFLWYVLQFIAGVSTRMVIPQAQHSFTLLDFEAEHPRTWSHRTNFHLPQPHTGPRGKLSTPDHVFESLLPRFALMT